MRRKSVRNAQKAAPEKSAKENETPPKTRRSRRRKRSPSKTSESEEEVTVLKKASPSPEETPDTTTKSHTPSDEETSEEPVWKITQADDTPKGELQKLKICLTRPSPDSPDKSKLRRSKSNSQAEDDSSTISEEKLSRRTTRSHGSPILRNDGISSQEGDEDVDEKKGKGKSKGKHKSKIEKSPHLSEPEIQTNNEISENVQVTPQSPSINKPIDKENDHNKVDADKNVNENVQTHEEPVTRGDHDSNKVQVSEAVSNAENKESDDDDEPLSNIQKASTKAAEMAAKIQQEAANKLNEETSEESSAKLEDSVNIEEQKSEDSSKELVEQQPSSESVAEISSVKDIEATTVENEASTDIVEQQTSDPINQDSATTELEEINKEQQPQRSSEEKSDNSDDLTNTSDRENKMQETVEETVSLTVEITDAKQKIPAARSPRHWLKRDNSYLQQDGEERDRAEEARHRMRPTKIKRKWENVNSEASQLVKVDLESIQTIWPTIDFPEEPDLSIEVKERRKSLGDSVKKVERKVSVEYTSEFSERSSFDKQGLVSSTTQDREDNSNIIAFNRKISIVDDTASKLRPPPSPAKNPISDILYITNLVRPFTVKQLKELLERTGKIQEEGFWTDRIKSKCYVQYETQEEAEATRNALHGVQWPIGNGKKLIIDYATQEDMNNAKNPIISPPVAPVQEAKITTKEYLEPIETKLPRVEDKSVKELEKKRSDGPIREWDIGKKDVRRDRSRSRERSRKHKRSRSPSDDFITRKHKKEEESVPQKLMDDLFLKTKATPSIYWQPLSPEEIAMKQQQRLMRMEEHKRRLEESSRMKAREIGRGAFRRRYD